jgi:ParB family chromosome partitioning protein
MQEEEETQKSENKISEIKDFTDIIMNIAQKYGLELDWSLGIIKKKQFALLKGRYNPDADKEIQKLDGKYIQHLNAWAVPLQTELAEIPLEKITPHPLQQLLKRTYDPELYNSIKEHGVIIPIIVKRQDDHYILLDGYRRYSVVKELKHTSIPAFIVHTPQDEEINYIIETNKTRKNLTIKDEITIIKYLKTQGYNNYEIIKKLRGKTAKEAYIYYAVYIFPILDIPEDTLNELLSLNESGIINKYDLYLFSKLIRKIKNWKPYLQKFIEKLYKKEITTSELEKEIEKIIEKEQEENEETNTIKKIFEEQPLHEEEATITPHDIEQAKKERKQKQNITIGMIKAERWTDEKEEQEENEENELTRKLKEKLPNAEIFKKTIPVETITPDAIIRINNKKYAIFIRKPDTKEEQRKREKLSLLGYNIILVNYKVYDIETITEKIAETIGAKNVGAF